MSIEGIVRLSHLGVLGVKGQEAKSFLQGQVTCNMEDITMSQSRLGGHCNLKGRLQSLFEIVLLQENPDSYALIMNKEMVPYALKQFKKYALFSKVKFTDESDNMPLLGYASLEHIPHFEPEKYSMCSTDNHKGRYQILCHTAEAFQTLFTTLSAKVPPLTEIKWEQCDIEEKIPVLYPQTIDTFLPHHVNLIELNGVSFNKGCYLGQEIIARMQYKGKIKKHLYTGFLAKDAIPQPGDHITIDGGSERDAPGTIVRCAQAENGYNLLMVLDEEDVANKSSLLRWQHHPVELT